MSNEHEPASQIRRGEQPPLVEQIARKSVLECVGKTGSEKEAIILAAIEKVAENCIAATTCYDCEAAVSKAMNRYGKPAAQPQRSIPPCVFCGYGPHTDASGHSYVPRDPVSGAASRRPAVASGTAAVATSGPQGEWTPEYVDCRLLKQAVVPWKTVCAVAAAHNAAIAAEREKWLGNAQATLKAALEELAAEQEKQKGRDAYIQRLRDALGLKVGESLTRRAGEIRQQLLAAQAAIAVIRRLALSMANGREKDELLLAVKITDLSALEQHDAELQAEIAEARAQRDWLIKECARVGVTVNVQIGAPITEAYRLVNDERERRKPLATANLRLVEALEECVAALDTAQLRHARASKSHIEAWKHGKAALAQAKEQP